MKGTIYFLITFSNLIRLVFRNLRTLCVEHQH